MKRLRILSLLILVFMLPALGLPRPAFAAGATETKPELMLDQFVFGGAFTLAKGDTLEGDLFILGGSGTLEEGSEVTGSVVLMGGSLSVGGLVGTDILAMGGAVKVLETATIEGDVTMLGAQLSGDRSRIQGEINNVQNGFLNFRLSNGVDIPVGMVFNPVWAAMSFLFSLFVISALATGLVMFLPQQTERVAKAALSQPVTAGGMGCLTLVALPFLIIALAVTIVLILAIPLVPLALLALTVMGWAALGLLVGRRLETMAKTTWHPAVAAGIGTFALAFVAFGISWLPCIGWIAPTLVQIVGLGAALLTRFGTRDYPVLAAPAPVQGNQLSEPVPPPGGDAPTGV